MEYLKLRGTDMEISRLSLGAWAFSGAKVWGDFDEQTAIHTMHAALDQGVNLIDTAEKYGDGRSEEMVGKAIHDRRDKAIVATKIYKDYLHYDDVIAHCDASLKRMNTDYIDIYQIHWPSTEIPVEETFRALEDLKKAGKIRAIGVCNHGLTMLDKVKDYPVMTNQMPYSLLWRIGEKEISPKMEETGIALWCYSPLAQGLLTGKFKTIDDVPMGRRETRFYSGKWQQGRHDDTGFEEIIFPFLDWLRGVCDETGYTMSTLAFAFLKSRNVGSILQGARNEQQLSQNIQAFETPVSPDVVELITKESEKLKAQMGTNPDMWENKNGGRMR